MEMPMHRIEKVADKQYVASQYHNSTNLDIRIQLHKQFSTNTYGWHRWVFDQLDFPTKSRILELGCGSGDLWSENVDRIPLKWGITLSDLSYGMIRKTRKTLDPHGRLYFAVADAQDIPFENQSFDGVIANHMLYHVPDRGRALSEIQRVLKPEGIFYASTIGLKHLQEIADLIHGFDPELDWQSAPSSDSFILENGGILLSNWFEKVTLSRYEDSLVVTKPDALVDYILSGRLNFSVDQKIEFAGYIKDIFQRQGEKLYITKDSGIFKAHGFISPV